MGIRFNRHLRGWLGLLDGKVGGLTPSDYEAVIRPTLDTWPHLFAQTREVLWGEVTGIAAGSEGWNPCSNTLLTVPQDEVWICEYISGYAELPVDTADRLVFGIAVETTTTLGLSRFLILSDPYMQQLGLEFSPSSTVQRRYIAMPGDEFGIWIALAGETVGLPNVTITMHMTRCKV